MANAGSVKFNAQLDGMKDLKRLFNELPQKSADKVLKAAVNNAATPVLKEARRNVPVRTGLLRKALNKKAIYNKGTMTASAFVGPDKSQKTQIASHFGGKNHGKGVYAWPSKYAHLVESGVRGKPGSRFLERAFESKSKEAMDRFVKFFTSGLLREVDRLARRANKG